MKYKTVAKNFKGHVSGGVERHLPIFSENVITYTQTRGFTLLNVKNKKCNTGGVVWHFDYVLGPTNVIDAEKNDFSFY